MELLFLGGDNIVSDHALRNKYLYMKTTSSFALRCGTDFNEKHTCLRAVHEVQFGIQSLSLTPELFVFVSLPLFLSFFLSFVYSHPLTR